ncbi:MAG: hypothetical protein E6K91_05125 [Thaumarchaeota archaeon]|nr:MAG: hypothetical protein E6K91_05125 [Nitrososphaerota archaeon]
MVDRWIVFVASEFVSAALGFSWGLIAHNFIFLYVGGFFFSLGVFSVTRWGFDRWKNKKKVRRRR